MIHANFKSYSSYITESLYQWDRNQILSVSGLNLSFAPEIHFSNKTMDKAIVRQSTLIDGVVSVMIPNSLLQMPLPICADFGIYEGETFKTIETISIPIIPKARPADYILEQSDDEIYSFKKLEALIANNVTLNQFNSDKKALISRIDNIIARNNDTQNNSELTDIRVDADGITYGSAGTAIRSQTALMRKFSEGAICPTFKIDSALFERGSWNHEDVKSNGETYRIRTINAIYFPYEVTIFFDEGFQCRGYWCDDSGVSVDFFSWMSGPLVIPANQRFKLIIARITEDNSETANIEEFANKITLKSRFVNDFETLSDTVRNIMSESFAFDLNLFTHGLIAGWDNGIFYETTKYRVATPELMSFPYDIIIRAKDGFRFALNYWNNGEFVSDELWQTEFFVPANQTFKMMIGRQTEDSEEIANIADFVSQIYIESGILSIKNDVKGLRTNLEHLEAPRPINKTVRSINHRGFNSEYPENTLIAFKGSKREGFNFVETDVRFTADNVPVLLHDATINRTGRVFDGSKFTEDIYIQDINYAEVCLYDFGIYKGDKFAGTTIPHFDEFIRLCRRLGLHPYIEIEGEITTEQAGILIDIVNDSGLLKYVTWITFSYESLLRILEKDPSARVGLNCITTDGLTQNQKNYIGKIKALTNNVFVHVDTNSVNKCVEDAQSYGLPLEVWCPNTIGEIVNLPDYVSGVTTDKLIAEKVISDYYIEPDIELH